MNHEALQVTVHSSMRDICPVQWDRLNRDRSPFLDHAFLRLLEDTQCVGDETGWYPAIVTVSQGNDDDREVLGGAPVYVKTHSAGEFVFDWSWADAAHRAGISYYPKAVVGVPFTPATGPRLLAKASEDSRRIKALLVQGILEFSRSSGLSSVHFNFLTDEDRDVLEELGLPIRIGVQYHWKNGGNGPDRFGCFDDFLAGFRSKRRANIRRERKRLEQRGVQTIVKVGDELCDADMERMFRYYRATVQQYFYGRQYLNEAFFLEARRRIPSRLHLVFAAQDGDIFGGACNFLSPQRLFGRYWGCEKEVEFAHFEVCIYRPVRWCIDHELEAFEPGAGGEHKYERGFCPTPTYSAHILFDSRLQSAVDAFVRDEAGAVTEHIARLVQESPAARLLAVPPQKK